ncbi:gp17 [Corynebacterium phage BFK20]|uniref:Gp17 n=1 Tax=Corynebacterium phage BFK20 TaxID=28358 RepID=Q9MBI7_9CAUD|nr:gp17 [Corynebacterium phage BFK20]CAB93923.2 gp17 [Corynebacterium phage BFK20]
MVNWKATRDLAHSDGDGWGYWLMDKKLDQPIADLHGMVSLTMSEKINQTTAMKMVLPSDHPAVDLLLPVDDIDEADPGLALRKLMDERQFIITEGPGGESERVVWVVARITQTIKGVQREEWEYSEVTVECKSLYRYIERLTCRADPNMPLIAHKATVTLEPGTRCALSRNTCLLTSCASSNPTVSKAGTCGTPRAGRA